MSFPQLAVMRLAKVRELLAAEVWRGGRDIPVVGGPEHLEPIPLAAARREAMRPVARGEHFGPPVGRHGAPRDGAYRQRWFRVHIPAPSAEERGVRYLHWICGGESTVYLDGQPVWGFDIAHPTWRLPDQACRLWLDCGCYMTGMNGRWGASALTPEPAIPLHGDEGLRFDRAVIRVRDAAAWHAFWDVDTIWQLLDYHSRKAGLNAWEPVDQEVTKLPAFIRRTGALAHRLCDAYDAGDRVALACELAGGWRLLRAESWQIRASAVGHSHLDLLHIWPEHEAMRKGVHTAATTLELMDRYPELTWLQTQSLVYEHWERRVPRLMSRVRRKLREGRWEASGGMLCEADTQLPCGEGLVRNLQLGQSDFRRLTGRPSRVLWLVDAFGQSTCMPQLMRLAGLEMLYTVKQHWGRLTRFPFRSWRWRGPDGSEVLGHGPGTGNYCQQVDLAETAELALDHQQAHAHPDLLLATGYGDGGGGVTAGMLERARRQADLAGSPRLRWDRAEPFLARMQRIRGDLPVWEGEIYLERHQGVSTGENHLKTAYRAAERAMQAWEAACAIASRSDAEGEADWRRICLAQFHDCITGTSIRQVFDAMTPELTEIAERRLADARRLLGGRRGRLSVFNPLTLARRVVVRVPAANAKELPAPACQASVDGSALVQLLLPSLGGTALADVQAPPAAWTITRRRLGNGRVLADFDAAGRLAVLRIDGEDIALVGPARLLSYPNRPMEHDAWDVDPWNLALGVEAVSGPLRITESGPVRACLSADIRIGASHGKLRFILEAGQPWLGMELDIDWQERQRLLKYQLPTAYLGAGARYGAPFGAATRSQRPTRLHERAQWECFGSRWAAVTDETGSRGLAVVTADRYGFSCRDGMLGATLLRGAIDPNPDADRGRHVVRVSIGSWRVRQRGEDHATPAAAECLYGETLLVRSSRELAPACTWSDLGTLVPSWVRSQGAGGLLLRAHECAGEGGSALLVCPRPIRSVVSVDLLGSRVPGEVARIDAHTWRIAYRPWQIVSLRMS